MTFYSTYADMLNYSSCISIKYYTYFNIVPNKKQVENLNNQAQKPLQDLSHH